MYYLVSQIVSLRIILEHPSQFFQYCEAVKVAF